MLRDKNTVKAIRQLNEKPFMPARYWISASLHEHTTHIRNQLTSIQPGLFSAPDFGDERNIHVGTDDEVITYYGTKFYFISASYLDELMQFGLQSFFLTEKMRQKISLCLCNEYVAFTGIEKQFFLDLVMKLTLISGNPIHPSNIDEMTILISPNAINNYALQAYGATKAVLSPDYITCCFDERKILNREDYCIYPFTGLTFTSSDLTTAETRELKTIVAAGRGVWKDYLFDGISFVVAERLSITPKIKVALTSGFPIIRPDWIRDHISRPIPFENYVLNTWCLESTQLQVQSSLFSGKKFAMHASCPDQDLIVEAVRGCGGRFSKDAEICISGNFNPQNEKSDTDLKESGYEWVTTQWIWACISAKKILPLNKIIYRPFPYDTHTEALNGVEVVLHSMSNDERAEVTDILRLFGAIIRTKFIKTAQFVISNSPTPKLRTAARSVGALMYPPRWVTELARAGQIPMNVRSNITSENPEISSLVSRLSTHAATSSEPMRSQSVDLSDSQVDSESDSDAVKIAERPKRANKNKRDALLDALDM